MIFLYDRNNINTQEEIKISLADLRDLVQAVNLKNEEVRNNEIDNILQCISKKNKFKKGTFWIEKND